VDGQLTKRMVAAFIAALFSVASLAGVAAAQDTSPPAVDMVYPLRIGELIGGTVTLEASASDNVGVVGVQFLLDGSPIGAEVTAAPWRLAWDSTAASVGAHQIRARARDAAGNNTTGNAGGFIIVYRTSDTTPANISGVTVTGLTSRSAVIQWDTDKFSDSQVGYGKTSGYGQTKPTNVTMFDDSTGHSIALTDLLPSTTYHYQVRSTTPTGQRSVSADLTFTTPADPPALSTTLTGWIPLGNTTMRASCSQNNALYPFRSACSMIIGAWSGGVWDSTAKRLVLVGGGHGDYSGNDIYALRLDAQGFERLQEPSGFFIYPPGVCEDALPDGNPVSRHTYNGLAYLPTLNAVWMYGGSRACGSGGAGTDTWLYNLTTRQWTALNPLGSPPGPYVTTAAYDAQAQQVYVTSPSALYTYTMSTNTWTKRKDFVFSNYGQLVSTIDPVRRQLVIIGGMDTTHNAYTCLLDSPYTCQAIATTGDTQIEYARSPGVDYDPTRDRIVAWDPRTDGGSVYELNPSTNTWVRTTAAGGPATQAGQTGTFGRWRYVPELQGFLGVSSADANAYVWRFPTAGTTTPPTSGAVSPTPTTPVSIGGTPTPLAPTAAPAPTTPAQGPAPTPNLTPSGSGGRISIPLRTFIVRQLPGSGLAPYGGIKHTRFLFHPPDGRLYQFSGDWAEPCTATTPGNCVAQEPGQYQNNNYSYDVASDSWRHETDYCQYPNPQPSHPDYNAVAWDSLRDLFWDHGGFQSPPTSPEPCGQSNYQQNQVMWWNPNTKLWAGPNGRTSMASTGLQVQNHINAFYDAATDKLVWPCYDGSRSCMLRYAIATNTWTKTRFNTGDSITDNASLGDAGLATWNPATRTIYLIRARTGTSPTQDLYAINVACIESGTSAAQCIYREHIPANIRVEAGAERVVWDTVNNVLLYPYHGGQGWDARTFQMDVWHPGAAWNSAGSWETVADPMNGVPVVTSPADHCPNPEPACAGGVGGVCCLVRGNQVGFDPVQNVMVLYGGSEPNNIYLYLFRYGDGTQTKPSAPRLL
jgi:hypothetical protein